MPLLGGLFTKRNPPQKNAPADPAASRDSTDGDYVLASPPSIYNLPPAASASKLKLPFRRKPPVTQPDSDGPSPPRISSVTSDSGHGLPQPPRKSSLFGVYNNSFHSLPNEPSSNVHSDTPPRLSCSEVHAPPAGHTTKKSAGLFSWARERTKSKPLPPSSTSSVASTSPSVEDSSFNLKSFRHVRTDSPAVSLEKSPQPSPRSPQPSPNQLFPPARPRPRDDSCASDSSQRISIAAFREAQARSRANSPVPSFRPPSSADTLRVDPNGRKRASTVSVVSGNDRQPPVSASPPMATSRPGCAADSSSDSESSEDDEEVDSDGEPIPKPVRKRTITRHTDGIRARSDAGHGPTTASTVQASRGRQDPQNPSKAPPPTLQSDQAPFTRPRASASTSALTPSGAARRASILAAANSASSSSHAQSRVPPQKPKVDPGESTDSSDADSEDMPLSDLVAPRRPGSSMSNQSNGRPRMPAKPLIDINSLAGGQPLLQPILRHQDSVKDMKSQEQGVEKDQPFSIPVALSQPSSPPITPSTSKQNVTSLSKPTPATHHRRSSGDVPAVAKPEGLDDDNDLMMSAIRLVGALDQEQEQPSEPTKPSDHIVPTPIRAREPPTSFTVLSRPHRQSVAEISTSILPILQPHSVTTTTRPAVSPQSEPGTRARTPGMTKFDNDKSDAISIASVARSSASRNSRIPSVPLIHSIPDSPSVKADYKPGRPRSAPRTPAVNSSDRRSQPPPVPVMSSASNTTHSHGFRPSLMPQRPFASDRPLRGESPAGSSTGDSSSGRSPFTPRDGSDIGVRSKDDASDMDSTLKARGHAKKLSVTFEDTQPPGGRERAKTDLTSEQKTRDRRRSEAKAAIELGKIVNGRGPLVHDDSDEDMRLRGRNPTINVTMENGHGMMPGWGPWQAPMGTGPMVAPQFGGDPGYLAAHQRALLIAKQAYQMAVAQQAIQMAGEEWERSSNVGFGSNGSVYGGGSAYGGGSGGSVYGGGAPMNVMGVPNMGMLVPPNQWGRSSVAFPGGPGSVYGGVSSSQSEFGGSRGGGWGTRSVYGDSFGSSSRASFASNGGPSSGARPRASTGVSAAPTSSRTPGKSPAARTRAAPPSSWKNNR